MADGQMLCWGLRIIGPSNRRVLAASSPRQGATTVVEQGACAPVHGFCASQFRAARTGDRGMLGGKWRPRANWLLSCAVSVNQRPLLISQAHKAYLLPSDGWGLTRREERRWGCRAM